MTKTVQKNWKNTFQYLHSLKITRRIRVKAYTRELHFVKLLITVLFDIIYTASYRKKLTTTLLK